MNNRRLMLPIPQFFSLNRNQRHHRFLLHQISPSIAGAVPHKKPVSVLPHSSPVRFSSGAAKPGWSVPRNNRLGPEIKDNFYYWEHPSYTGFVLWLRGVRPYIEKILVDCCMTIRQTFGQWVLNPAREFVINHNPDIRLQLVAFFAFYFTAQSINLYFNRYYQKLMDLKRLKSVELSKALEAEGFFLSESEDLDHRVNRYSTDHRRLNSLWDAALEEASSSDDADEGFKRLCSRLVVDDVDRHPAVLPSPITWRFNMIPYGKSNVDTQTNTAKPPSHEQPHRAFALNFTYNNLAYDWGDYIERLDNKPPPMRPSRMMFTDVYIPPTK